MYDMELLGSLCSFDSIISLRSTETHEASLKDQTVYRHKLGVSLNLNQMARYVNSYFSVIEFSIRLKKAGIIKAPLNVALW